jgi:DNA-binding NarL/FixJ family response regulator
MSRALRVAVLSRHALTRAGLIQLLSYDSDRASVVGDPMRGGEPGSHDVLVYDLTGHTGFPQNELATLLAAGVPVVALISNGGSQRAEAALAMGVTETVQLDIDAPGLLQTLERAAAVHTTTVMAPRRRDAARADSRLTDREISILELIGSGLLNQDIAERLYLSGNTIKSHIRSTYRKIGVTRRAEAVLWAVRHDLNVAGRTGIE